MRIPLSIGALTLDIFNWWILVCGKNTAGNPVPLALGADGSISTGGRQASASSNAAPATTNATVFTLAAGERGFIQNLDDAALAVKYGTGCSTSSLTFILKAGSAADDGLGGSYMIDDWIGPVSVCAMTGTARYIATKLS